MAEATIRDVARRSQVSIASVSRALNGHDNVRPETRAKVIAAAKELGYVPHAGARSLSMARSHAIGVVLPDLHGEFFSEIVRGIDREASELGLQLLLSNMHADIGQATQALRAMRGRVDGLLIMSPQAGSAALFDALPPVPPAVLINCPGDCRGRPALRVDNRAGAIAVTEHLIAQRRRNILHIAGPVSNIDAQERADGFREAMARYPDAKYRIIEGNFLEEAGETAALEILASGEPVDAIFAANDMMAIGALHALRQAEVAVPEKIAVAGFDDIPLARYLSLTTMRVCIADMGSRAVVLLNQILEGNAQAGDQTELCAPELVVRETTVAGAETA